MGTKNKSKIHFFVGDKEEFLDCLEELGILGSDEEDIDEKDEEEMLFGNYPKDFEDEDFDNDLPFDMDDLEYFERQVDRLEDILAEKNQEIDRLEATVEVLAKRLTRAM